MGAGGAAWSKVLLRRRLSVEGRGAPALPSQSLHRSASHAGAQGPSASPSHACGVHKQGANPFCGVGAGSWCCGRVSTSAPAHSLPLPRYNLFVEMTAQIRRNVIYNVYLFSPTKVTK